MGGIGKTVVATAFIQDDFARTYFCDGTAWLTFGRDADPTIKAGELAAAITGRVFRFETVDAACGQLRELTQDLALLIVLDDVWEPEATDPFSRLGPKCRVLITTRDGRVLTRANAVGHDLDVLSPCAARELLARVAGLSDTESMPPEADAIIRHCGRLPLALAAGGALIGNGGFRFDDVLRALEDGAGLDLPADWLPDAAQRDVGIVMRISVDRLPPDAKACFLACAAFREDVDIPETAIIQVWLGTIPTSFRARLIIQQLVERSLLIRDGDNRYRIHSLYFDLLQHMAKPLAERHEYLIDRYRENSPLSWRTCVDDGYILRYLPWHLREARKNEELRALLFDPRWILHKLVHTDVAAIIGDYSLLSEDREAELLTAALALSANVLARTPEQFAHQLCGRLLPSLGPTIARLLDELSCLSDFVPQWGPYLTPPGAELRRFEGHSDWVMSVAVLPDGRRALSASDDWTLRLWEIETGTELRRFMGHDAPVNSTAVLLDGRRAVSASNDRTLHLWDIETGTRLRRFDGHNDSVRSVALLPDGRRLLSASDDRTVRLWDIETGQELRCFVGHDGCVNSVAVLPDGRRALSASDDWTIRLWDIETGAELRSFKGHNDWVTSVAVLSDGHRALSTSEGPLLLWDIETGAELRRLEGHDGWVTSVAVLAEDRALSSSYDRTLRLWDLETGTELRRFVGHDGWVRAVAMLPDGHRTLSASDDRTLRLWDIEAGVELQRFVGHDDSVRSVTRLPDGRRAISSSRDHTVRLWDIETGTELRRFNRPDPGDTLIAVLPDGQRAISASSNQTLRLWDIETGAELQLFEGHDGWVRTVAVLSDGDRVLSGSDDRTLRLWDIETGVELRSFDGHNGWVTSIAPLPDGCHTLSATAHGTFHLWDIETGAELQRFDGHDDWITSVAVLPDGRRALSASRDRTIRLWSIETGEELRRLEGHDEAIRSLAILSDSFRAVSVSDDRTLRLWDIETGKQIALYRGDTVFTTLAMNPTPNCILTGNQIGQIARFRLNV
jgi:WD40 repeat protein